MRARISARHSDKSIGQSGIDGIDLLGIDPFGPFGRGMDGDHINEIRIDEVVQILMKAVLSTRDPLRLQIIVEFIDAEQTPNIYPY
jgi:hypothetical protein